MLHVVYFNPAFQFSMTFLNSDSVPRYVSDPLSLGDVAVFLSVRLPNLSRQARICAERSVLPSRGSLCRVGPWAESPPDKEGAPRLEICNLWRSGSALHYTPKTMMRCVPVVKSRCSSLSHECKWTCAKHVVQLRSRGTGRAATVFPRTAEAMGIDARGPKNAEMNLLTDRKLYRVPQDN